MSSIIVTSYFERLPAFVQHPRRSIRDEFNRLAKTQRWTPSEKERQRVNCYNEELEGHFKTLNIHDKLKRLQYLCAELDVEVRDTVSQCKKELGIFHVNLVDLMDALRNEKKAKQFPSLKKLVEYTIDSGKVYPKKRAKGTVVSVLLRRIFS